MTEKTGVAIASMKAAQSEMVQWENRIEAEKQNYQNLKRQSDLLQQEIDKRRMEYDGYISSKEMEIRGGREKLLSGQKELDAQRAEFARILDAHTKDKQAFSQEKLQFAKEKSALDGQRTLVNNFVQAVRRAINVLPD